VPCGLVGVAGVPTASLNKALLHAALQITFGRLVQSPSVASSSAAQTSVLLLAVH